MVKFSKDKSLVFVMLILFFMIASLSNVLAAWNPNFTAYYKFNNDINDSIGIHNLTESSNLTTFVTGKLSQARNYTTAGGTYMDSTSINQDDFNFSYNPFSIIFWMSSTQSSYAFLMSNTDSNVNQGVWVIRFNEQTGKVSLGSYVANIFTTNNTLNDGNWHRVALVRYNNLTNGATWYVDGNVDSTVTVSYEFYGGGEPLYIGGTPSQDDYTGLLDDVQIYNGYALTSGEITADWNNGAGREATSETNMTLTLVYPLNNFITNNPLVNFTANFFNPESNISNATLFVYNQTSSYNETFYMFSGNYSNETLGIPVSLVGDGNYSWLFSGIDFSGNYITSSNRSIRLDTVFPILNITFPENITYFGNPPNDLNYTLSELYPNSCWFTTDYGITNTTLTCGKNVSSSSYISPISSYLKAYFKFDNDTNDTIGVHNLTSGGGNSFASGKLNQSRNCSGTSADSNNHNLDDFNFGLNNFTIAFWIKSTSTTYSFIMSNTDSNINDYVWVLRWYEMAGKVSMGTYTTNVFTSTSSLNDGNWHRVVLVRYNIGSDGTTWYVDGSYDNNVTVSNNFSGAGEDFYIGGTPSQDDFNGFLDDVQIYNGYAWSQSDVTIDWNSGAGREAQISNIITITPTEGVNTWTVYATDTAGNLNYTSVTFSLQNEIPTIDFVSPTDLDGVWYPRQYIITNVSSIVNSTVLENITTYLYNMSGYLLNYTSSATSPSYYEFWTNQDGQYKINATACNSNGCNYTETRTVSLDTQYPLISYGTGTADNNVNLSQNWIYINTSWTEINFANITFNLFNSTWDNITTYTSPAYSINITDLGDGPYWYYVNITDSINNINSTPVYNITLDTHNPNATILAINNETNGTISNPNYYPDSSQTFILNATDNLALNNATLNITGILINGTGYNNITTVNLGAVIETIISIPTVLSDGIYTWFWSVYDFANNLFTTTTQQSIISTTGPIVTIDSPDENNLTTAYNQTYLNINFTLTSANPKNATLTVTGPSYNSIISTANIPDNMNGTMMNITYNYTFTSLLDGAYSINVLTYDYLGNLNTTIKTVYITGNAPVMNYVAPTILSGGTDQNFIEINITATDLNTQKITTYLYYPNQSILYRNTSSSPYEQNLYVLYPSLANGLYYFNATAYDIYNNTASLPIIPINVESGIAFTISFCKELAYSGNYVLTQNINKTNGV